MVYDRFLGRDVDGGLLFGDTASGQTLKTAPSPESLERAQMLSGGTLTGGELPPMIGLGDDGLTRPASADLAGEVMRSRLDERARLIADFLPPTGEGSTEGADGPVSGAGAGGAPQGGGQGGSSGEAGGAPGRGHNAGHGEADAGPAPRPGAAGPVGGIKFSGSGGPGPRNYWAEARDAHLAQLEGGGGGGGGGGPARSVETPTGRQVVNEGAPSPETMVRLQGVVRRDEELGKRQLAEDEAQKGREAQWLKERGDLEARQDAASARDDAAYRGRQEVINQRREQLDTEIGDGKIDPNQFWGKMPMANKAMALIGVMLGAKAAGSRGTNEAMGILEKAIDRDIDAQKANLAKKQWQSSELGRRYQQNRELMGDEKAARLETKAAALRAFDAQTKQRAIATGSKQAALAAEKLSLKADERIAQLYAEADARVKQSASFGYRQVGGGLGGTSSSKRKQQLKEIAELDDKAKKAGDGEVPRAMIVDGEAYEFRDDIPPPERAEYAKQLMALDAGIEGMSKVQDEPLYDRWWGTSAHDARAVMAGSNLNKGFGEGAMTETNEKMFKGTTGGPLGARGAEALKESARDRKAGILKNVMKPKKTGR